jgi:alpha-beta hydrolase superfamily lysophospholipase
MIKLVPAVAALAIVLAGCTSAQDTTQQTPTNIPNVDLKGTGPGSLIEAKTMPNIDRSITKIGATAVRVVYRSTSGIDGSPTEVSGAVFVPVGHPPAGGWPVIAFAHGTTGIQEGCAPSLSPDLFGATSLIVKYLKTGFAVAAADYQGLGSPGGHPYLDAKTAGLNVIDSVRALRAVSPEVSATWGAFGGSQGGGATWAANEQASTYATDLKLVGSVSLVPAADISGFAQLASDGKLTNDQQAAYIWLLMGLENTRPDFDIDSYRHGLAKEKWDVLGACTGPEGEERNKVLSKITADDLKPASPEATEKLTAILEQTALPQQHAAAPMQIFYGGEDTYIDHEWTTAAIQRACDMGDTIEAIYQPDKGHGDVDGNAYVQWLGERFEGLPAPNNCPRAEESDPEPPQDR